MYLNFPVKSGGKMIGKLSLWLAGVIMLAALAQAQNNQANGNNGRCGAPHGPNSDPCAHMYKVPPERMTQLLMDNAFCMFYSRTHVACSKPLTGNYGQQASGPAQRRGAR